MGVATVALAYDLTRRRFGRAAGFAAGLVLATTPITVAISRHNNPDALLVLCVTAALWCIVRALEDGRTRWLVCAGVCVGLGFETKMGAALLVVPAIAAAYAWVAPRGRLAARAPARSRAARRWPPSGWRWPRAGVADPGGATARGSRGRATTAIWSLIFGYNGLGRLDGQPGGPRRTAGGGPGGGGRRRPLRRRHRARCRLLNEALGGQAGWLLGFAVVGGVAVARRHPAAPRRPAHRLADRGGRRVRDDRGRLQRGQGHLPPVLRLRARAVHGGARRRGRRPRRSQGGAAARIARAPAARRRRGRPSSSSSTTTPASSAGSRR